jgi:DegV family protein with EDD domain
MSNKVKKMYKLFCDSNCELWYTYIKELGVQVIRMPYTLDGKEYFYDLGENTDFEAFYKAMRNGSIPKTSALNEFAYTEYFEPILASGEDIYYITFSHAMSATFAAMDSAIAKLKQKYPERVIRTIDSTTISMGTGLIVYYAALKYNEGVSMDELDTYVKWLIDHTATYFAVEDLTYLYRGGRISGTSKVFGTLLNIKPILCYDENGKILNVEKVKGFKKALTCLKEKIDKIGCDLDKYKIIILQADNKAIADEFKNHILADYPQADVELQPVGPVIGAHCGPGTIGLIFHSSKRMA